MQIKNAKYITKWYSAIVEKKCTPIEGSERDLLEPVYGYRLSLIGATPEEQKKEQDKWEKRNVHTSLKTMDHDEEGLPEGTRFLEVSAPQSKTNLEAYWKKQYDIELNGEQFDGLDRDSYPVFDENEIRSQPLLDFKTPSDWDRVTVASGNEGKRINLDRLTEHDQTTLFETLKRYGISEEHLKKGQRVASLDSNHCKKGDRTLRLMHPADLERLTRLFNLTETPHAKWEWRNLANWQSKNVVDTDGKSHLTMLFNMNNLSDIQSEHMYDVLSDLGIEYSATLGKTSDSSFLCVTGAENIKALSNFTKPWFRSKDTKRNKEIE